MSIEKTTLEQFYKEAAAFTGKELHHILPKGIDKEIGHFNVFDIANTIREVKQTQKMPYNRRAYYKISLIRGKNRAEYADKVIDVASNALLFATPKVPYHWIPLDENQAGMFCIFTKSFMEKQFGANRLDELPIFKTGGVPVFEITNKEADDLQLIFNKMEKEIATDYEFKYDLLRNYVSELIHQGQKLQPATIVQNKHNASERIVALFIELLERQFPLESPHQRLDMRTAYEFATRLSVHVNHLNKVLKENTGKTTTEFISGRMLQEAKILLKQTNWSVSEIAYSLGFEEVAHFSNFFKKQTQFSPLAFRS